MRNGETVNGYWTYSEEGDLEYRDVDTEELLDTMPFPKARSLAAFFLWQVVESFGSEEE